MEYPKTKRGLQNRIDSYRKAMNDEKREWGYYNDGHGLRYILFSLYFLLDEKTLSKRYITWFDKNFDDDCGEPVADLCRALILFRRNEKKAARIALGKTMLSNLYIIPFVLGREVREYDMWHSSNTEGTGWLEWTPDEVVNAITDHDKKWLQEQYDSQPFTKAREEYIAIYKELETVEGSSERGQLLTRANELVDLF